MPKKFEEKYEDVLQNIEFALVQVYRRHAKMVDWDAMNALDALIRTYQAEARKRAAPALRLAPFSQEAFNAVKAMCEWRLGREQMLDEHGKPIDTRQMGMTPKTVDEIIACLKRVRRSVETWHKRGGQRGYYEFVRQFIR